MDTAQFLKDLRAQIGYRKKFPIEVVERETGLSQGHLSNLLSGKVAPRLPTAIKLWPFAYGTEFPNIPKKEKKTADQWPTYSPSHSS